jgi:hypothetical protein
MKTTTFTSFLGALAALASSAAAAATPHPEVVWSPKITSPTNKTVWYHNTVRLPSPRLQHTYSCFHSPRT